MPTRGILAYGAYLPYWRLNRASIAEVTGTTAGRGHRSVASFDEDSTTMGVEATRTALAGGAPAPEALWFSTVAPAYLDKTNATAIHAALRFDAAIPAVDFSGAARSAVGALRAALGSPSRTLVVASDLRVGRSGGSEESEGGDAAVAVLVGSGDEGPLLAEYLGGAAASAEFTDRWRIPGEAHSRTWEDRFGEQAYGPLVERAWADALRAVGLEAGDVDRAVVTGLHRRATARSAGALRVAIADDLATEVGNTGAAHPTLLLAHLLDSAEADRVVALVVLADGCDVLLFRTTGALGAGRPARTVSAQLGHRADVPYGRYLVWRGLLDAQAPNRPAPSRTSSPAALRRADWKLGFVGSRDTTTGITHLPPSRIGILGGVADDMEEAPMADAVGEIVTVTVDRLAYSPSPPVVFAVVDFEGGGRMPVELADVDPDGVAIGDPVEMTFRRLNSADGIHNYFWKARPVRA